MGAAITGLSIDSMTESRDSNGAKIALMDITITTASNTAGAEVDIYVGFKYKNGDGHINYNSKWIITFGSSTSGTVDHTFQLEQAVDHLACGGTFAFWIKTASSPTKVSNEYDLFINNDFRLPYANYTIPERPTQLDQVVYYNGSYQGEAGCCVSCACASAKEVHEMRSGKGILQNSVGWFFGATGDDDYGTTYKTALDFLVTDGILPYRYVDTPSYMQRYPDVYWYTDRNGYKGARTLYLNNDKPSRALPQRIKRWVKLTGEYMEPFHWQSVIDAIQRTSGSGSSAVLMTLGADSAMHSSAASSSGYVPDSYGSFADGHMMLVLGWKTYNNRLYWVCQNSWGRDNGDNGIYYIPFTNTRTGQFDEFWTGIQDFYELVDDPNAPEPPSVEEVEFTNPSDYKPGHEIKVYASDMNRFRDKIDEIIAEKGLAPDTFRSVGKGEEITAQYLNNFYYRIVKLGGYYYTLAPGEAIKATHFTDIRDAINSIIRSL